MAKEKFSWSGFFAGLKTLLSRNALLIVAINIINQYSNNMKNGYRTLVGVRDIGLAPAAIGTAVSVFMIAGLICRAPAGSITDNLKSKLKYVLSGAMFIKAIVWLGFLFIKSPAAYYVLFFIDGITWSFAGTALPAVLALSVDRRAMGSGYAVMMGLTQVIGASARPLGISLYNNYGIGRAAIVSVIIACAAAVLALFLDAGALVGNAPAGGPKGAKKKGFGISMKVLPLALVAAMPIVLFNTESNFMAIFAEGEGLEYLAATTLGGSIAGILSIFVGVLCDIINPSLIIIVALLGEALGAFFWSISSSSRILGIGIILYYTFRFYATPLRIMGMKSVSRDEQGALSSTMLLCNDAMSLICNPVVGALVGVMGYRGVFRLETFWTLAAVVVYIILDRTALKKMREATPAD